MLRMRVDRTSYPRPEGMAQTRRLIDADATELNRLYALEDDGLRYSGRQVREGIYYGAYSRGRLVAAAGTHIYSPEEGVAVVGNVFTHPDYRGHGFGSAVTAAVVEHLLMSNGRLIVLNVDPANRTAHHIYEMIGFSDEVRLVEAMITRRAGLSPMPLLRRTFARWRAQAPGSELLEV
jgi:predicted GNAT family acetyltransferase